MKLFTAALFALLPAAAIATPLTADDPPSWGITSYTSIQCDPTSALIVTFTGSGSSNCTTLPTSPTGGFLSFDTADPSNCTFISFQDADCTYSAGDPAIIGPKDDTCYTFTPTPPNTSWNSFVMVC